jgi:hypothetical protein
MTFLIIYWVLTTVYGVYWLIKNPSRFNDKKHFTVLDVIDKVFPSMLCSPVIVPIMLLNQIKFKR